MSTIYGSKEYGEHSYPAAPHATSDCKYGCGCWAGPSRSGGPLGLDPFGKCPNNPVDGVRLGENRDYENVVAKRITDAESRAHEAEKKLKEVSPSKLQLAADLAAARNELAEKTAAITQVLVLLKKFNA